MTADAYPRLELTDERHLGARTGTPINDAVVDEALALAERFHEAYERLAPGFGYTTRTETRAFDPQSANGRLMVAVCQELLADGVPGAFNEQGEKT